MNNAAEDMRNLGSPELTDRVRLLEAENTRLQALVCYLVRVNEQLRQQNCPSQLSANTAPE